MAFSVHIAGNDATLHRTTKPYLNSPNTYSDAEFAIHFSAGDERAFRYVFDMQVNPLCFFAQKLIGRKDEAEDMVSTAFYKLWQRHKDFTSLQAVRSFLYTTVRNQCLDFLKHRTVVQMARQQLINDVEAGNAEAHMFQAELLQLIYAEIQALPDRYRQILEWSFLEELSTADIGKRLQMTESHVRVERSRALVQLRESLRKRKLWEAALLLFVFWQTV